MNPSRLEGREQPRPPGTGWRPGWEEGQYTIDRERERAQKRRRGCSHMPGRQRARQGPRRQTGSPDRGRMGSQCHCYCHCHLHSRSRSHGRAHGHSRARPHSHWWCPSRRGPPSRGRRRWGPGPTETRRSGWTMAVEPQAAAACCRGSWRAAQSRASTNTAGPDLGWAELS